MHTSPDIFGTEQSNAVQAAFKERYHKVIEYFFSRNATYWPCFADPGFRGIIDFRAHHLHPDLRLASYPRGTELLTELRQEQNVRHEILIPNGKANDLLEFAAALSKDWENPSSVENVVSMPCDPGIYGSMVGSLANPNLVYSEYAGMAAELEASVIRQIASLVGYDPAQASGIFTQGGTFCNLYGYLTGIRKSLPDAKRFGMGHTHDYRIINSQGGHYSNITNLSLLGVDIQNKTIRIKMNENNDIDLKDLERHLHACFRLGCAVPTIMLTMGTTDTFAVDSVRAVCELRDSLCEQYEVRIKPHVHVDSAIGWSMIFFLNYDFTNNPLSINAEALAGLKLNSLRFQDLKCADSFTIDFQKWGYVPYTSSLVMFKNKEDIKYLENDPLNFSYFERDLQGRSYLQSTIECSRGAAGLFGAYSALKYLGVEGYQMIIAHCLQNANYCRYKLHELAYVKVLVPLNQGPSVGFRMYNPALIKDAEAEFAYEYGITPSDEYQARLKRNNDWHRAFFLSRGKIGLYNSWVEFVAHTGYDEHRRFHRLPGEKAVFMNPATTHAEIDAFVSNLRSAEGKAAA